jgi:clusterin-associated protein 1
MSYRELRNFTEIMRALGYPRLISMENFRKPNFELVADILYWMVKLYDPETTVNDRVEFENERVQFLTSIASTLASKARLKLNTKKLYASDGRAVQELLKLATLLYKATKMSSAPLDDDLVPPPIKILDVKAARGLASDITQSGAKLYEILEHEVGNRPERLRALRFLDVIGGAHEGSREHQFMESSARELIEHTRQAVEDMRKECEELDADERNTEVKIKKKQEELERTEKRLRSLENVRPQFMDEVEKLEKELQRHYDVYMEKYRNLDYLEHELAKYHRQEEERMEEHDRKLKKMREKLLKEEVEILRGHRDGRDTYGSNDDAPRSSSLFGSRAPGEEKGYGLARGGARRGDSDEESDGGDLSDDGGADGESGDESGDFDDDDDDDDDGFGHGDDSGSDENF